ncbi:urea transporter [Castellaniella sp.]|uniref:urea transporter n=1 Tax=Castellaniella sp. TaxID=1955812 RepID=UPI00356117C2
MASENNNFLTVSLRGAGQVFFMENALTGLLFLVAIAYASYDAGQWATTIGAIIGLLVATVTAMWMGNDKPSIQSGLFGFNGILVGVALPTFIAVSPLLWFYIIVGAAVSTVATATFAATLTKSWGVPGSTGPFVLTAWLMVGGAYAFGALDVTGDSARMATDYISGAAVIPAADELVQIFFRNIAQVFLLGSAVSGVIILIGIFIASRRAGLAAAAGSLVAMICAIGMRVDPTVVIQGLYGFSPVLTAMAVGVIFLDTSAKVVVYALLATVATVFVQAAYDVVMSPLGLPSFTAPYVLTMYLFVAPKKALAPHPHAPVAEHQLDDA